VPLHTTTRGVEGEIPAAKVHDLQQMLPALTRGEGVLESAFERYEPVRGPAPSRPRTDNNPLDRKEYLLRVVRRAGAAAVQNGSRKRQPRVDEPRPSTYG
jgi:ribosomal protection tetracycline resistance protein